MKKLYWSQAFEVKAGDSFYTVCGRGYIITMGGMPSLWRR